jgi:hypothetical protein
MEWRKVVGKGDNSRTGRNYNGIETGITIVKRILTISNLRLILGRLN